MKCKHETTRKLFWLNQERGKWIKTNFSICLICWKVVGLQPVDLVEKDSQKSLKSKTKNALGDR
jgi:hypothetical protein